jgi:BRCA1-associated protein
MPAYFFHIAFELYQQSSLSAIEQASQTIPSLPFIPPQNYNIFSGDHLHTPGEGLWTSVLAPRRKSSSTKSNIHKIGYGKENKLWNTRRNLSIEENKQAKALAIEANNKALSEHNHPNLKEVKVGLPSKDRTDWRFSEISIDSIDMDLKEPLVRAETRPTQRPQAPGATQPLTAAYTPTNPQTTEFGWGVVHLYRDELENGHTKERSSVNEQVDEDAAFLDEDCTTLCILAVPSYMTHSDLLGWVGEETREQVSHFRLVRTDRSNRFMVLLKFRDPGDARNWQKEWNGKLFNSMEVCYHSPPCLRSC